MPENQRDFRRYEGMQVNVCFNYGGRDEIVRAARHFAADCAAGGRKPEELTEVCFPNTSAPMVYPTRIW